MSALKIGRHTTENANVRNIYGFLSKSRDEQQIYK
jgi:hypothetical protein